jgi:UDP-2-acetamido-2-deoxy-ribo-hexuluronate aminotransferase
MTNQVPFIDLETEWKSVRDEALLRISKVFEHGSFLAGPEIEELELRLASYIGCRFAITCSSGTTALLMSMMALGVGPGDEVIVPDFTFIAPAECALVLGASPVLVDIETPSGLIDPGAVEEVMSPRTKAIVAVSLFGLPANFDRINEIAAKHSIPVIEDAAQSFGSRRGGKFSGALADVGCTSFYPTKVLGGAGDGGAVFTNDRLLAERLAQIRDHGQQGKYHHVRPGLNGRLNSISAAAILARFNFFEQSLQRRRRIGMLYDSLLDGARRAGLIDFSVHDEIHASARSQYPVIVQKREPILGAMNAAGVQTQIHYPIALHEQPVLRHCRRSISVARASTMAAKTFCLPIHPGLTDAQVEFTTLTLRNALKNADTLIN